MFLVNVISVLGGRRLLHSSEQEQKPAAGQYIAYYNVSVRACPCTPALARESQGHRRRRFRMDNKIRCVGAHPLTVL